MLALRAVGGGLDRTVLRDARRGPTLGRPRAESFHLGGAGGSV